MYHLLSVDFLCSQMELHFQIQPAVQIVPAQPGQVFGDDAVDTLGLNVLDHALETGPLES